MPTGTYSLEDLRQQRFASAAEFGLDTINKVLQADLLYYNAQVQDQLQLLAEPLTEQSRVYGASASNPMVEVDEYGVAPSHETLVGTTISFPLKLYKSAIGWTSKYLEIATPEEIVEQYLKARRGHAAQLILQLRRAIFNSTNYTHVDKLTNGVSLTIRRLINADGEAIPDSPAGVSFTAATHDHYNARVGTLANSDVDSLVSDVTEHGNTRGLKIIIALSDKATLTALTGFVALGDRGFVYNANDSTVRTYNFDDLENQLIGYWRQSNVEVWVKPWALASYWLCVATGIPEKCVGFRQRKQTNLQGLRIVPMLTNDYPLIAQNMEAEFGFGIWNRSAAAVLYTGGTSFVDPGI
jgi:hypothetical protein